MKNKTRKRERGMSLIELMIALTVLTVGLAALMALMATAISTNTANKLDTGGTLAAQAVLETIAAQPGGADVTMYDCAGNTLTVKTAPDSTVLLRTSYPVGDVDFTQASGITAGYSANYVGCGPAGRQVTYDVRWTIQTIASGTGYSEKLIVVGAAQSRVAAVQNSAQKVRFMRPVTLRTISATGN
ncbi:MAG: type IV pilus modification PilV family protein [Acidobacteriaceae bacterium]